MPWTDRYDDFGQAAIRQKAADFLAWRALQRQEAQTNEETMTDTTIPAGYTSRNRLLTFNGRNQTISAWAKELGIPASTISKRLRLGWSDEEALKGKATVSNAPRMLTHAGRTQTIAEWAKEVGLAPSALKARLRRGVSVAEALTTPAKPAPARRPKPKPVAAAPSPEPKPSLFAKVKQTLRGWFKTFRK